MSFIRKCAFRPALLVAALVLSAGEVPAVDYVFTGWVTANRGKFLNIPVVGNVPCSESRGSGLVPAVVNHGPGSFGSITPPATGSNTANASGAGCVKASGTIMTTGAGTNGAFVFPPHAFSKPLQGILAVPAPGTPQIIQLATDFAIGGPNTSRSPYGATTTEGPTMTGSNAVHRSFMQNAHAMQSGRAGAMFTWCPGNPYCVNINGAPGGSELIVKYAGGATSFGGTMGYVIDANPLVASSLALILGTPGLMGPALFAPLGGMGEQPTGNGYAFRQVDMIGAAHRWGMYKFGPVTTSILGMRSVITAVSGTLMLSAIPPQVNVGYGFPWTTNTVVARNTGSVLGNPMATTISAVGNDSVTASGKRNISLVAGGLAHLNILGTNNPGIMQMYLPEPSGAAPLLAAALGLLAVAAVRRRRRSD